MPSDTVRVCHTWRTPISVCLGFGLCGMILLTSCSTVPIPPPYTQDELKARCESRGGRWHDGDPMRSFCEYDVQGAGA
jgi:hypothetical protein